MIDINSDLGESFGSYRMGADEAAARRGDQRQRRVRLSTAATRARWTPPWRSPRPRGSRSAPTCPYPDLVGFGRRRMHVSRV